MYLVSMIPAGKSTLTSAKKVCAQMQERGKEVGERREWGRGTGQRHVAHLHRRWQRADQGVVQENQVEEAVVHDERAARAPDGMQNRLQGVGLVAHILEQRALGRRRLPPPPRTRTRHERESSRGRARGRASHGVTSDVAPPTGVNGMPARTR